MHLVNLGQFKSKQCLPLACSMEHPPLLGQFAARITGRCTHGTRAMKLVFMILLFSSRNGDDDGAAAVLEIFCCGRI